MSWVRRMLLGLLAFLAALAAMAVSAAACGSGGGSGKEATTLTTTLSGGGSEGGEITVSEGTKVKDKGTLSGKNVSKATGKVKYDVYSDSKCEHLVTAAGEGTVSGESVTASSEESLEAGKTYYWQATYEGNETNSASTSSCGSEVLNVKASTSLSTKLSGGGEEGEEITVNEGTKVKDKATLTGTNSSTAGGKALYKIFSDKECKTLVKEVSEVAVSSGSVPASSEEELVGGKTYYWQATYKGDTLHKESTSSCGTEVLKVKAKTTLATTLSGESKEGTELTVIEGSKVTDKATVEGTNSSTAEGKVLYKLYSDSKCEHLYTEAGEKSVSSGAATASNEEEPEGAKVYYWQATYKGDGLHQESTSECGKEILTVKAKTSLATMLSGEGKESEEITVLEGTKVKDTATLSGTNFSTATGKVTYKVYSDDKCESLVTTAGEETIESGGEVPASNEEELKVGTYYWQAGYAGDSLHEESKSGCSEILAVKTATSLTTSLSGESEEGEEIEVLENAGLKDHATLSGTNASKAGGTVVYKVYSDKECQTLVAEAGEVTVTSGSVPASNEEKLKAGTYYWQASYSGDSKNKASTSACGSEVSIVNVETTLSTSLTGEGKEGEEIEVHEEYPVSDTATLAGTKASKATGTVEYAVYSNSICTELADEVGTVNVSEGVVPASEAVALSPGTYYWQAYYSGDELDHGSKSPCTEVEIVTDPSLTTSLSGESKSGEKLEVQEGASVGDNATLHIKNYSTATGTVKYDVYSDEECKELVAEAGEVTVTAGSIPESNKKTLALGGPYYWQASYSGDEKHPSAKSACGSEIETVGDSTSLSTSLSGESKSGEEITVEEGAGVSDTATLSGTKASEATGTVEYNVYPDKECKEEPAAEASTVTVTSGVVPASAEVKLPAGTYYWQATYYGDSHNQGSTSTCDSEKEVVKEALTTSLSSGGKSGGEIELQEEAAAHDTATLHEENSSTATGTVKYYVYSDSECKELVTKAGEVTVTGGSIPSSSEETLSAGGEYYWQAVYSGDEKHPSATSICGKEVEQVKLPWIVSVGDSYISGEAGRWAGNTRRNSEYQKIDALGNEAYYGAPNNESGGEAIPYCHRSKSAEIFIGGGVRSRNLACSGAEALSRRSGVGLLPGLFPAFTPGLDFADEARNHMLPGDRGRCPIAQCEGQALQLEKFALARKDANEEIKMVVVSIGGDNFGFPEVVKACVTAFLRSLAGGVHECNTEAKLKEKFEEANVKAQELEIEAGLKHVGAAMERAGFAKAAYTILVQDYPSPIPENAEEFRYEANRSRLTTGGCPLGDNDAHWANHTALEAINETVKKAAAAVNAEGMYKIVTMDLTEAFKGRRLCETNLKLVGEREVPTWQSIPNTINKTEWINQVRFWTHGTPFSWQEDLHPNYWGQLALRNCVRQAYDNGTPKGGTCKIAAGGGMTADRLGVPPVMRYEPKMELK
jgi:hypothetical protein